MSWDPWRSKTTLGIFFVNGGRETPVFFFLRKNLTIKIRNESTPPRCSLNEPYTWLTRTPMLAVSPTLRVKLHFRCGGVLPEGGALPVWGCTSGVWVHLWCRGAAPAMFSSVSSFLTPFGTIFFGKIMFANIFTVAKTILIQFGK